MAKRYGLIAFDINTPYVDDRGITRNFNSRFVAPPDFTAANITALAALSGGRARLPTDPKSACPDPGVQGRRLTFIRSNGNSVSVPIRNRLTLINTAIAMRNLINGVTGGANNPVVCVKLEGEYFPNLFDELALPGRGPSISGINSSVPANGKQNYFYGTMEYLSDANYGQGYFIPFKVATNAASGVAPTMFAPALNLGNVVAQNVAGCPGTDPRTSRRYIVQSVVADIAGAGSVSQTAQIPVATHLATDILAVGVNLAAITSTQCLGYQGESNDRFHKLLP